MSVRELAVKLLDPRSSRRGFLPRRLERALDQAGPDPRDRGLLRALALGVTRHERTLDVLVGRFARRDLEKTSSRLRAILRLGAYQLLFLPGVPDHAAIGETVGLARTILNPRMAGVVNAILRSLQRLRAGVERADPGLARDAVYLGGGEWVRFKEPVLVDPAADPARYVGDAYSLPDWLAERWTERWGVEKAAAAGRAGIERLPLTVRVNRLRGDREKLLALWRGAAVAAAPGAHPLSIHVAPGPAVEELPGFAEGLFQVQDVAAMEAADLLEVRPGERIVDLCAGPGGKATQIAEAAGPESTVVALDDSSKKALRLRDNATRLGLAHLQPGVADARKVTPALWGGKRFDAVLLDAPCSNTGVLARRPDARWRVRPRDLETLGRLQDSLLDAAAGLAADGGRILYSTCSLEPEENRGRIDAFLGRRAGWRLDRDREWFPTSTGGGGYAALLKRQSRVPSS